MPNDAETFRKIPHAAERKENHTLTVRETVRMFEQAGVPRTERSIINWCQPNRQGITRLDCYYDPNERKYYITPQSVETAIQEEIQRASKQKDTTIAEPFGSPVTHVKHPQLKAEPEPDSQMIQELERKIRNLDIANQVNDRFIKLIQQERKDLIEKLEAASRTVGQLETKVTQLELR